MSTVIIQMDGTGLVLLDEPGEAEQVARDLLSLAESKFHVQSNTDNGQAFVVPAYLAEAYASLSSEILPLDIPAGDEPAPRRTRRPRARKEPS